MNSIDTKLQCYDGFHWLKQVSSPSFLSMLGIRILHVPLGWQDMGCLVILSTSMWSSPLVR